MRFTSEKLVTRARSSSTKVLSALSAGVINKANGGAQRPSLELQNSVVSQVKDWSSVPKNRTVHELDSSDLLVGSERSVLEACDDAELGAGNVIYLTDSEGNVIYWYNPETGETVWYNTDDNADNTQPAWSSERLQPCRCRRCE